MNNVLQNGIVLLITANATEKSKQFIELVQ